MAVIVESVHERAARERQLEILRAMPPSLRLEQAQRLNRGMRILLVAGFRARNPTWTGEQIRRAVADRILHARTD